MGTRFIITNDRCLRFGFPQVFMDEEGDIRVLKIIRIGKKNFVQCLKTDAIEAIYRKAMRDIVKINPKLLGDPMVTHFTWPYEKYQERVEKEWEWLGELV